MVMLYATTGDAFARIIKALDEWRVSLSLVGKNVQCLATDPHDPATLFAGTRGHGIWRSEDSGDNWQALEIPQRDVFSLAISAADGALYAGTEPSHLFVSHDRGESWQELEALLDLPSRPQWSFPPRPWTSHVSAIAPSPHDAALLLVGIELGGLMRSDDGGRSWQDHRPGAEPDVHAIAWHPEIPGRAYQSAGGGAAWSSDRGNSWTPADTGRDLDYCWGLAVDPLDADRWWVSAAPNARHAHGQNIAAEAALYRWSGDGPWKSLSAELPQTGESMPRALTAVPGRLFAGLANGCIYESGNGGEDWSPLAASGDPLTRIETLAGIVETAPTA